MKVLIFLALFGYMAAPVLSGLTNDLLAAGDWEEDTGIETDDLDDSDWEDEDVIVDFGRGVKDKLKKVVKEIPVMRSCKCTDTQCGCCLVFMTEEKNISSCLTIESITEKEGIQFTMEIGKTKKELFVAQKTYCFDFETGIIFACAKPYGTTVNKEGVRSCLQISLKIGKFKIVSADLNCFRISGGKFSLEDPKDEERPKKGFLNKIVGKLTKGKKDKENKE